jgi:hypothetical protein
MFFSATSPIHHLKIHINVPIRSAILITASIAGLICGILGGGGSEGSSRSAFSLKVGSWGSCGGGGSTGISGTLISIFASIGEGRLGSCGRVIFLGTKLKRGSVILIHKLI